MQELPNDLRTTVFYEYVVVWVVEDVVHADQAVLALSANPVRRILQCSCRPFAGDQPLRRSLESVLNSIVGDDRDRTAVDDVGLDEAYIRIARGFDDLMPTILVVVIGYNPAPDGENARTGVQRVIILGDFRTPASRISDVAQDRMWREFTSTARSRISHRWCRRRRCGGPTRRRSPTCRCRIGSCWSHCRFVQAVTGDVEALVSQTETPFRKIAFFCAAAWCLRCAPRPPPASVMPFFLWSLISCVSPV